MIANQDNSSDSFNFEDFISDESAKEMGMETGNESNDESAVSSPQEVTEQASQDATETEKEPEESEAAEDSQQELPEGSQPVRAPNEPEWKYEYRLEIWQKQQEAKNASSETEKKEKRLEMDGIRKKIAERSRGDSDESAEEVDSREDIYDVVEKVMQRREMVNTVQEVENTFLARHADLNTKEKQDAFFTYIDQTFNWRGQSPKQLNAILELGYETLYPKRTEKVIEKSEKLAKKLDAVEFSGSSASGTEPSEKEEQKNLVRDIKSRSGNDFSWVLD